MFVRSDTQEMFTNMQPSALEQMNKNFPHTSYLALDQIKTAYIIGNGQSRIGLDLDILGGDVWGCNALFRDYTPDYLTIVDVSIMGECAESAYPKYNQCYFSGEWTEPLHRDEEYPVIKSTMDVPVREWIRPEHTHITMHGKGNGNVGILEMQAIGIEEDYKIKEVRGPEDDPFLFENFFCGTTASAMASMTGKYDNIVYVGFDSIWNYDINTYNNVYAGTRCYGLETDPENTRLKEEDERGWMSQTNQLNVLLDRFQNIDYYYMKDELSVHLLTHNELYD